MKTKILDLLDECTPQGHLSRNEENLKNIALSVCFSRSWRKPCQKVYAGCNLCILMMLSLLVVTSTFSLVILAYVEEYSTIFLPRTCTVEKNTHPTVAGILLC